MVDCTVTDDQTLIEAHVRNSERLRRHHAFIKARGFVWTFALRERFGGNSKPLTWLVENIPDDHFRDERWAERWTFTVCEIGWCILYFADKADAALFKLFWHGRNGCSDMNA